jgi:exonuclease SbcC
MPKITAVEVWGFESHVKTKYELSEGLTVITGPSDGGKTSGTLRAIRWVATGEPSGEEFLHTKRTAAGEVISQAEEVGVRITLDNGSEVTKIRRKGKTKYWVTGFAEPFEKAEVPEAVKEALGIRSTVYGRDAQGKPELEFDLNFAYQLDPPFIISQPGSAGAKVLGKLAGTEAIDQALKSVAKDTYAARNEKAAADKEYERKVMQLLDYQGLDEIKSQIEAAEWLTGQIETDLSKKSDILALRLSLDRANNQLAEAAETLDKLVELPSLEEDLKAIEKAQQRYDTLLDLYGELGRATATVENLTQQIKEYDGLESAAWLLQQVDTAAYRQSSIYLLGQEYHSQEEAVKTAKETLTKTKDLDLAAALLPEADKLITRQVELAGTLATYREVETRRNTAASNVKYLAGLDTATESLTTVAANYDRLQPLKEVRLAYIVKEQTRERAQTDLGKAADEINLAEKELAVAWQDAGGICPLCEQSAGTHAH